MKRRLAQPGEFSAAQRRMIRRFELEPSYRPVRGRTRQTFEALLRKDGLRVGKGGKIVLLVRLKKKDGDG